MNMVSEAELESVYQEDLDEQIVIRIAEVKNITMDKAMDIYYRSNLYEKIYNGKYGIQYLDAKILAERIINEGS